MTGSIRLDPNHGLNPSMGVCFWCGEDDGTIALVGYNGGKEAPRRTCHSYEPCKVCEEKMATGVTLIQATNNQPDSRPEIQKGVYPTGNWVVVKEEAAKKMFNNLGEHRKAFVDVEAWAKIGLPA